LKINFTNFADEFVDSESVEMTVQVTQTRYGVVDLVGDQHLVLELAQTPDHLQIDVDLKYTPVSLLLKLEKNGKIRSEVKYIELRITYRYFHSEMERLVNVERVQ